MANCVKCLYVAFCAILSGPLNYLCLTHGSTEAESNERAHFDMCVEGYRLAGWLVIHLNLISVFCLG